MSRRPLTPRDWNPLYTLRWTDSTGDRTTTGTSREIHDAASRVHKKAENEEAWDIAVFDGEGIEVTGRFFNQLDRNTARAELGLTDKDADWLFHPLRTRDEVLAALGQLADGAAGIDTDAIT